MKPTSSPKKKPSDYPVYVTRCTPEQKAWLEEELLELEEKINAKLDLTRLKRKRKNEILFEALEMGMKAIRKKYL